MALGSGTSVADIFVELGVSSDELDNVGNEVESAMQPAFGAMRRVGKQMTAAITAPLTLISGQAARTAGSFNEEFAKIRGLVDTSEEVQGLKQSVLDLAGETARAPQELAQALFFVESAGFRGSEAMSVLEQSAKAAAAGLGETKEVADAVTSAVNAYGIENLSAQEATDTLVATVREGKVEASELAGSLGRVIPIASEMGVEFNEVGATIAALTRLGSNARQSVTALSATMRQILKPTKEARTTLQDMGLSVDELRASLADGDIIEVLQKLAQRFEETDTEITKVFSNARALRGVLGIVGESADEAAGIMQRMADVSRATSTAFQVMSEEGIFAARQALRNLQSIMIRWGQFVLSSFTPIIRDLNNVLNTLEQGWRNLGPAGQRLVGVMTAIAAATGPVLLAIGALGPLITNAVSIIGGLIPSLSTLGGALGALVSPWGLLAAAAVGAAVAIYSNWQDVVDFFTSGAGSQAFTVLQNSIQRLVTNARELWSSFTDFLQRAWSAVADELTEIWNIWGGTITAATEDTFRFLAELFSNIVGVVSEAFSIITGILTGDWNQVMRSFLRIGKIALNQFVSVWQSLLQNVLTGVSALSRAFGLSGFADEILAAKDDVDALAQSLKFDLPAAVTPTIQAAEQVEFAVSGMGQSMESMNEVLRDSLELIREFAGIGELTFESIFPSGRQGSPQQEGQPTGGGGETPETGAQNPLSRSLNMATRDAETFTQTMRRAQGVLQRAFQNSAQMALGFSQTVGRGIGRIISDLVTFQSEIDSVGDAFRTIGSVIQRALADVIQRLIQAVIQALIFRAIITAITSGGGSFFPSFGGGANPTLDPLGLFSQTAGAFTGRGATRNRTVGGGGLTLQTGQSELVGGQIVTDVAVVRAANERAQSNLTKKGRKA